MSPEVRNASPRLKSATISAGEEWRSVGGGVAGVARLCTTVELTGGGDVVADVDRVSVLCAACTGSEFVTPFSGGWSIDPSSLIGLLSSVLSDGRRSAERCATTVAAVSIAVELTGV
jgi:hypothetical protein